MTLLLQLFFVVKDRALKVCRNFVPVAAIFVTAVPFINDSFDLTGNLWSDESAVIEDAYTRLSDGITADNGKKKAIEDLSVIFRERAEDGGNYFIDSLVITSKSPGTKVNLKGVNVSDTFWINSSFLHVDLTGANLKNMRGGNNVFNGSVLKANLRESAFLFSKFRDVDFTGAELQHSFLFGADFKGAILEHARLTGADLRKAENLTCAQLTKAFHWQKAYRDPMLACGATIPVRSSSKAPEA